MGNDGYFPWNGMEILMNVIKVAVHVTSYDDDRRSPPCRPYFRGCFWPLTEATLLMPVTIPKPPHIEQSMSTVSNMSMISIRATALDVCEYVYGDSTAPFDAIARFYETNASQCFIQRSLSTYLSHNFFKCKLMWLRFEYYLFSGIWNQAMKIQSLQQPHDPW
jgi:hypothetical protein